MNLKSFTRALLCTALYVPTLALSKIQTIEQLVIVYSPYRDHNGAFQEFDESLSELMQAARKRQLRVVLIDTDAFENTSKVSSPLKDALEKNVRAHKSLVMMATHGGTIKNADGTFDTALAFPGGMSFQALSSGIANESNLAGIVLESCSSGNDALLKIGQRAMACGVSQATTSAREPVPAAYKSALAAAISLGSIDDLPAHMRNSVANELTQADISVRQELLGPTLDFSNVPIYGPKNFGVVFEGNNFEIIDVNGRPMIPCEATDKPGKILSLPAKALPDVLTARLLGETDRFAGYFESHAQRRSTGSFSLNCSPTGKLTVLAALQNTQVRVSPGETVVREI